MPGDEIHSLRELALDCKQHVKVAPMEMKDEFRAFWGGAGRARGTMSYRGVHCRKLIGTRMGQKMKVVSGY
jgi:hypothetical protein